jgi:HK97 family phage portal protein
MKIVERFAQYLLKKSGWSGFGPDRWFAGEQSWFGRTAAGIPVTPEHSLTCATVSACVRLLSSSVASLPCYVYRDTGRSKLKAPEHKLWSILLEQPNDYQTGFAFWQHVMAHCLLEGNLYAYIQRNDQGDVTGLWPLRRGTVVVEVNNGLPEYHYVWGDTKTIYSREEILHFKNLSLNGFVGMSTLQMAREGIGEALAQSTHAASLFRNRARPGLAVKFPAFLTPQQRQYIAESFKVNFDGAINAGKTAVLEGGVDLAPVGFTNEDSQFMESREFSVREIARWFGVPAHLVGDVTRTSYNSSEMEMLNFLMHSLRPWLVNLESEVNSKLFPSRTQFFARFDSTALARSDMSSRYSSYSQALASGWMTIADVREAENLPFIEGTDKLLQPANMLAANNGKEEEDGTSTTDTVPQDAQ